VVDDGAQLVVGVVVDPRLHVGVGVAAAPAGDAADLAQQVRVVLLAEGGHEARRISLTALAVTAGAVSPPSGTGSAAMWAATSAISWSSSSAWAWGSITGLSRRRSRMSTSCFTITVRCWPAIRGKVPSGRPEPLGW
jgi:hypothetical protein